MTLPPLKNPARIMAATLALALAGCDAPTDEGEPMDPVPAPLEEGNELTDADGMGESDDTLPVTEPRGEFEGDVDDNPDSTDIPDDGEYAEIN